MDVTAQIKTIAEAHLKDDSFFIVDVISKGVTGRTKYLILLDGDGGVTIDNCAELSRKVSSEIETEDLIKTAFVLEVSSPGLDQPLALKRQYKNNIGRKLKIKLTDGSSVQGKLEGVSDKELDVLKESKEKKKIITEKTKVLFNSIEKANVLVSFN